MKKVAWIGLCVLALAGCKDKDDDNGPTPIPNLKVTTTLSGAKEIPANASTATGAVDGDFNDEKNILKLNITYTGLDSLTGWHIHKAAVDTTGPVVISFGNSFSSPFAFTDTLTADQKTDLKAGLYYVNIHTKKFPNGEIRGQLKVE